MLARGTLVILAVMVLCMPAAALPEPAEPGGEAADGKRGSGAEPVVLTTQVSTRSVQATAGLAAPAPHFASEIPAASRTQAATPEDAEAPRVIDTGVEDTSGAVLAPPSPAAPAAAITPVDPETAIPVTDPEYVILTDAAFEGIFNALANWKTMRGTPSRVYTTAYVYSTYAGADDAEKVRNFTIDLEDTYNITYLLLGGDSEVIPTRMMNVTSAYDDYYACDAYYAGLNSTWDDDSDGEFGETASSNISHGGEFDWDAEVYVGRLPVDNVTGAGQVVAKLLAYEKEPPAGDWVLNGTFAGSLMDPPNTGAYQSFKDNAMKVKKKALGHVPERYSVKELYDYHQIPGGNYVKANDTLNTANFGVAMNAGAGIVNTASHGATNANSVMSYMGNGTTDSLGSFFRDTHGWEATNGLKLPLFYASACNVGRFDETDDSNLETLVTSPTGGAVAFISGSNTTYRGENSDGSSYGNWWLDERFWDIIFNVTSRPGEALYIQKADYFQHISSFSNPHPTWARYYMTCLTAYNLLGDPEMPIWTDVPEGLTLAYPVNLGTGAQLLNVTVFNSTWTPVEGALVTLLNGSIYERALTDAYGRAAFALDLPEPGTLNVTASALNHIPATAEVPVVDGPSNLSAVDAGTPEYVPMGDTFRFDAYVLGGAGEGNVSVEYRYRSASPAVLKLNRTGGGDGPGAWYSPSLTVKDDNGPVNYTYKLVHGGGTEESVKYTMHPRDTQVPILLDDSSDTAATTGDTFSFDVTVTDNLALKKVTAEHWYGNGSHANLTLSGSLQTPFTGSLDIDDTIQTFYYRVNMYDTWDNHNTSGVVGIDVVDDDNPRITGLTVDEITAGSPVRLQASVTDNVGVDEVWIKDWSTGSSDNESVPGSSFFFKDVEASETDLTPLLFTISARDTSGNWATLYDNISLVDITIPVGLVDGSDTEAYAGEEFRFALSAHDNIGLDAGWVEYKRGTKTATELSLANSEEYGEAWGQYSGSAVLANSLEDLGYRFRVEDTSHNENSTDWVKLQVTDRALPVFGADTSSGKVTEQNAWGNATTGGAWTFQTDVTDNIGVQGVLVEFSVDGGVASSKSMDGPSPYAFGVTLDDKAESLSYRFSSGDTSGNLNVTDWVDVPVQDVVAPEILHDVPWETTTGGTLELEGEGTDNTEVARVGVTYTFLGPEGEEVGGGAEDDSTAEFAFYLNVPVGAATVEYTVWAIDEGGNIGDTGTLTVEVTDVIPPEVMIVSPESLREYTIEPIHVAVDATDNIGVTKVTLIATGPEGQGLGNNTMELKNGTFRFELLIMEEMYGNIVLTAFATDAGGNVAYSGPITVVMYEPGTTEPVDGDDPDGNDTPPDGDDGNDTPDGGEVPDGGDGGGGGGDKGGVSAGVAGAIAAVVAAVVVLVMLLMVRKKTGLKGKEDGIKGSGEVEDAPAEGDEAPIVTPPTVSDAAPAIAGPKPVLALPSKAGTVPPEEPGSSMDSGAPES